MFGILQKMDRYSNSLMSAHQEIEFIQELIDFELIWKMHKRYQDDARLLLGLDLVQPKTVEDLGQMVVEANDSD